MADDTNLSVYDMNNGITYIGTDSNKVFNDGFILNKVTQHDTVNLYESNIDGQISIVRTIYALHRQKINHGLYLENQRIYTKNISASLDLDSIVNKSKR